MTLSASLLLIAALLALPGLTLLWGALSRKSGRAWRAIFGLALLSLALPLGGLALLLRNYLWLLEDRPVAQIALKQSAPQRFQATLSVAGGEPAQYEMLGDEWQLDARVIRWRLPAALAGLPPVYALERLSGRYGDPKQELASPRSVHDLRRDWDFWEFRQRYLARLPIADARWGSAAYLPMLDGVVYTVSINPRGGLVAKPADAHSEALLRAAGW